MEVVSLIHAARQRGAQAINTTLIDLCWYIGQFLHRRIEADGRAQGTVVQLAAYIAQREPGVRGVSAQNLWRMRQFFQAHPAKATRSTLLRGLPWSSPLQILSRTKRPEERAFYLRMATQQRWQVRGVARQVDSGLFERAVPDPPKLSTALRDLQPQAEPHVRSIGSEYPVQVGGQDFALDRDARKPHEYPAIGVLLCASEDGDVVEYALSRGLSPALVAQSQTQLPDKKLLTAQRHEFDALNAPADTHTPESPARSAKRSRRPKP